MEYNANAYKKRSFFERLRIKRLKIVLVTLVLRFVEFISDASRKLSDTIRSYIERSDPSKSRASTRQSDGPDKRSDQDEVL